jgi:predicted metal-dependent phosphoesterase TrpH
MIDLHAHTTASDGQHRPEALLRKAKEAGVDTLAVTDHDTSAGLAEAEQAAGELGIELVPGIELSAFIHGRETHILGHFVDRREPDLNGFSAFLRGEREKRMHQMVEALVGLGVACEFAEVVRMSGGQNLGRPHLARVLVERGHVKDVKEAFDRWLGNGRPAFVERYQLRSEEAILLIRRAGGTATVAHAAINKITDAEIALLKEQGLSGVEVSHPDHSEEVREHLAALAKELDLVPTAGSDFHGELIVPGRKLGSAQMDPRDLVRLKERAARTGVKSHDVRN